MCICAGAGAGAGVCVCVCLYISQHFVVVNNKWRDKIIGVKQIEVENEEIWNRENARWFAFVSSLQHRCSVSFAMIHNPIGFLL